MALERYGRSALRAAGATLDRLLEDGIIDEVLGRLRSGKEAEVYRVRYRGEVVVAKVYKDRQQRSFQNNADYREGRKVRNSRTQRAMDKGSRFGKSEAEEAWKTAESQTLHRLHAQGVRVPTPLMFYEGVLLMQMVTDAEGFPAPRLIDAVISPDEAGAMYRDIRRQVVAMLCCDLIHGDLSPYNILLAAGGPTIIDFPQTLSAAHNSQSEFFFRRDLDTIFQFFAGIDRRLNVHASDAREIWRAYARRDLTPEFVPRAVLPEERRAPPPQRPHSGPQGARPGAGAPPFRGNTDARPDAHARGNPRANPRVDPHPPRHGGHPGNRPDRGPGGAPDPRPPQRGRHGPIVEYVNRTGPREPSAPPVDRASAPPAPPPRRHDARDAQTHSQTQDEGSGNAGGGQGARRRRRGRR